MKINYLFYICDGIGSVFDSQVLALLKDINERNIFKKIYLLLGIRNEEQKNDFLSKKVIPEVETIFYKTYPNYPFFNYLNRRSIKDTLRKMEIESDEVIFHTRGEMIAWHLSNIPDKSYTKNVIPDVRGASIGEIDEFYDLNKYFKSLKIYSNKKAIKELNKFHRISVVSNALKEYLITNYKIDPAKIFITPCLTSSDFRFDESRRDKIRKELNLKAADTLIVFSSGGTANWQNNEVLIKLARKGMKVLNLSRKEINHKNIINKFVNYNEMPAYLNAADIAIIWRDKSIVNKVASPVKFSEYVCCGVPVIANNSVDMITEYIKEHNCGLLIDSFDDLEERAIQDLKQKDRNKISNEGISSFGVETVVDKYLRIYSSVEDL